MPRKPRLEIEGGLYHVITRGNNRQLIFHSPEDYLKLITMIELQKVRLLFRLYAYCLMSHAESYSLADGARREFDQPDNATSVDRI